MYSLCIKWSIDFKQILGGLPNIQPNNSLLQAIFVCVCVCVLSWKIVEEHFRDVDTDHRKHIV